jgi:hypothetical protein
MTPAATAKAKGSSPQTEAFFADLLQAQPVMYGPDPKIVGNHRLAPRTEHEERALKRVTEEVDLVIASNRLEVICESAKEMLEQIGAAPGAKWGDLTCGIYTAKGDLDRRRRVRCRGLADRQAHRRELDRRADGRGPAGRHLLPQRLPLRRGPQCRSDAVPAGVR